MTIVLPAAGDVHPLAMRVIPPPRTGGTRDIGALEAVMQGLALDSQHPLALEIARTKEGRQFIIRADTQEGLEHVVDQIQARYPQAKIVPLERDPMELADDETVSAVELKPGGASYLPLRAWKERELTIEGTDPLLGLLGALSRVPDNMRAVSQLALVPASPTWSRQYQRMTVEHPLEPERQQLQQSYRARAAPGWGSIMAMGVLVTVLLLWMRFSKYLPHWVLPAGNSLLHGRDPHLTPAEMSVAIAALAGAVLLLLLLLLLVRGVLGRRSVMYDMRQVAQKTGRSAYRVRLRLFVIESRPWEKSTVAYPEVRSIRGIPPTVLAARAAVQHIREVGVAESWRDWRRSVGLQKQLAQVRWTVLDKLTAAYRQFHSASGAYFVQRRLSASKARELLLHARWAYDLHRSRHFLSVQEVLFVWHLPQGIDIADIPLVERARARSFLAPVQLTSGNGWRIGVSSHAGHDLPVYLPLEELRHNLLAIARTGKGKSTLFLHLAQAHLSAGEGADDDSGPEKPFDPDGLFFIEPHGDAVETLLGLVPDSRLDDVVLIDLANRDYPPGINPIDATLGRDRDKAVDNLITICHKLWENSWGPRTENVLDFSLKTLADANETLVENDPQNGPKEQYTLLDVVPLLRNVSFRHSVTELVRDPVLTSWWKQYYEPMDLRFQMEVISSVINKMSKFASSRVTRRILGQPHSTINLTDIIRQGKILLVSTASGVVGAEISSLLGATLMGLFSVTLAEQAELERTQRRRFLALIDEFQVYQGADLNTMLAELRKSGGSFGLATQSLSYLDKIDRTLRSTVLANVDHLFAFTMAGEDARLLHELEGIEIEDIVNLDDFTCYVKASYNGTRLPIFSLRLDPPAQGDRSTASYIRYRSQQGDAKPFEEVDKLLRDAAARSSFDEDARGPSRKTAGGGGRQGSGRNQPQQPSQPGGAQAFSWSNSPYAPIEDQPNKGKRHPGTGSARQTSSPGQQQGNLWAGNYPAMDGSQGREGWPAEEEGTAEGGTDGD